MKKSFVLRYFAITAFHIPGGPGRQREAEVWLTKYGRD